MDRALLVLSAFRPGDSALPLRVLAARTGLYKSTILRLLASLERAGAVVRENDAGWSPGPVLLHWGSLYRRVDGLESRVVPLLESLAEGAGGIAAYWVRLDGDRRICVFRALPPRAMHIPLAPGDILPMGGHATGRVFEIWGRPAAPEQRPEVVVAHGAREGESTSLSAPVFRRRGELAGALTLSGASERFLGELERARTLLADAAATLTRVLGPGPRG